MTKDLPATSSLDADSGPPEITVPRCQNTAKTAVEAMLTLARENAKEGTLSLSQLERIADVVSGDGMRAFYCSIFERCHADHKPKAKTPHRNQFLGRIMGQPLEPLLFATPPVLSRKMLPRFFIAVQIMIGGEHYDRLEAQAAEIYRDTMEKADDAYDWQPFFEDKRTVAILTEGLIRIARGFAVYEANRDWFIALMDGKSPETVKIAGDGDFTRPLFLAVMTSLIRPLHPQCQGLPHRDWMEAMGTKTDHLAVEHLLKQLAGDTQVMAKKTRR